MPTALELAAQYRAAVERADLAALNRLIRSYGTLTNALKHRIDALVNAIAAEGMTAAQVARSARYKELMAATLRELKKFETYAEVELTTAAETAIKLGGAHALGLMDALGATGGNGLPVDAIKSLLGFLDTDSPLYKRLHELAPFTAQQVSDKLLEAVAFGYNPRKTAGLILDALGHGLSSALRMARTVQLYSYREASRATYAANPDLVSGWVWAATLDDRTCVSCLSMHGTIHKISETLNDHHNGRCAMIPLTEAGNPLTTDAQAWFDAQPEETKRAQMGGALYDLYSSGKVEWGQMSKEHNDDVYGPMRTTISAKDVSG